VKSVFETWETVLVDTKQHGRRHDNP